MIEPHAVKTTATARRHPVSRRPVSRRPVGQRMLVAASLLVASVLLVAGLSPGPRSPEAVAAGVSVTWSAADVDRVGTSAASGGVTAAGVQGSAAGVRPGLRQLHYESALAQFRDHRVQAIGRVAVARSLVASAQLALDSSAGRVLTETSREALAAGIRLQAVRISLATGQIDQSIRRATAARSGGPFRLEPPSLTAATSALNDMRFGWAASLDSVRAQLAGPVQAVQADVAAWQAEQARLAAAEAARVAAEAARAQAAAASAGSVAAPRAHVARGSVATAPRSPAGSAAAPRASVAAPALFNKLVWTSGFQSEIDACRGAVDVTGNYGVATIAEHWSCGGARFPGAGRQITLSGVRSGTYLVGGVVAVLNANTQGTANIPRGYDLLYQTCINGSNATMSFTALTRIG